MLDRLDAQGVAPEPRTYNTVVAACNMSGRYAEVRAAAVGFVGGALCVCLGQEGVLRTCRRFLARRRAPFSP